MVEIHLFNQTIEPTCISALFSDSSEVTLSPDSWDEDSSVM